jgi:hypothetical protein
MDKPTWSSIAKQIQELNSLLNELDKRMSSVESTGEDTNRMVVDLMEMTQYLVAQVQPELEEASPQRALHLVPPDQGQSQN